MILTIALGVVMAATSSTPKVKPALPQTDSPQETFIHKFEDQLTKANEALYKYSTTSCYDESFSTLTDSYRAELSKLGDLLENKPDNVDHIDSMKILEEGYGILYLAQSATEEQNDCIKKRDEEKEKNHISIK